MTQKERVAELENKTKSKYDSRDRMRVRITFIDELLGTASSDPNIHDTYIASKAPDAATRAEEVKAIENDENAGSEELHGTTIFPKDENGNPFIFAYQIKGFFKSACAALQRCKGKDYAKNSNAMKAYRKFIAGTIFVEEDRIPIQLPENAETGSCQRPLRADTPQGERTALANSETAPEYTTLEFTISCNSPKVMDTVREWLDYGVWTGLGQWRNSGKGRFVWEEIPLDA